MASKCSCITQTLLPLLILLICLFQLYSQYSSILTKRDKELDIKDKRQTIYSFRTKDFHLDLNLETDDMEDIASFILDRDDSGMSYFGKALNDPKTLVEMAWWTLKGRDALNSISEYFVNEIKNQKQISYQKGLEDGKKSSTRVVYKP